MSKFNVIGTGRPYVDAREKVTGKARYVTDVQLPGMLIGKALRSPYPHAKILNIDTSEAEKVPGVKCIITGKDVEQNLWGPVTKDQYLLAVDKVRYVGDEVVAVAAVDETACDEALTRIKVEYEPLPAVLDMFDAMKEDAPLIHDQFPRNINPHMDLERGNVDEVFANADYVFENEYYITKRVHQAYMEPMGGVSVWDERGYLTIYAGVQNPTWCRRNYAHALNIPVDKVRVVQTLYGGGFGAKLDQQVHPLGALIARYAGQPVRFVLSRSEDFQCGLPRVPMYFKLKTAWSKYGKFLAKDVYILADNGAYAYYGTPIALTAMYRIDILYKVPTVRAKMDLVYTNKVPTSCYRGFGNAQMHVALETQIDEVAEKLGIEPTELRLRNVATPGYVNPYGWKTNSCEAAQCIEKVAAKSNFLVKKSEYQISNKDSKIKRGIGMGVCVHVSGNRSFIKDFEGAAVLLRLNEEGRVYIYSNEPDMGQGIRTVTSMCVSEILDIDLDDINVPEVDTDIVPFGLGCFASRGTYLVNSAAKEAAINLRTKLFKKASEMMKVPVDELQMKNKAVVWSKDENKKLSIKEIAWQYVCDNGGQQMLGEGFFIPDVEYPDANKQGNISGGYSYGAHVAEVEVNTETGQVSVLNIWAAHDVGQPINPLSVEGQIQGGVGQAFGWTLTEQMVHGQDGKLVNPSFLDYQIPTAVDMPKVHPIIVDSYEWTSGFGAKSIGEASLIPTVPAIVNAIYNAIGVRFYELPITAEKIVEALRKKESKAKGGN